MTDDRAWVIEVPPRPDSSTRPALDPELQALARAWKSSAEFRSLYTADEIAAMERADAVDSWAAEPWRMFGPLTILARDRNTRRVVAGVELWQQKQDRYWFLADLVRDQASEYRGVGREVVEVARGWWATKLRQAGWPLRVYAMTREVGAVRFWSNYLGRAPELTGEMRSGNVVLGAVGWVVSA